MKECRGSRIIETEVKLQYRPHKASGNCAGISGGTLLVKVVPGINKKAGPLSLCLAQFQDESCSGKNGTSGEEAL